MMRIKYSENIMCAESKAQNTPLFHYLSYPTFSRMRLSLPKSVALSDSRLMGSRLLKRK